MKKYELILQGGIKIPLSEEEKTILEKAMLEKESILSVGNNQFRSSMIKGIFEIKEDVNLNKRFWIEENQEWHQLCLKMSKYSIDDKTDVEIDNRILNGLRLMKISLSEQQMAVMRANIMQFFKDNPRYPRCPMRIWWPFIADIIAPISEGKKKRPDIEIYMGRWLKMVARNDEAIAEWLKYYHA